MSFDLNFVGVLAKFQIQTIELDRDAELIHTHRQGRLLHFQAIVYLLCVSFHCLAITHEGRQLFSQVRTAVL